MDVESIIDTVEHKIGRFSCDRLPTWAVRTMLRAPGEWCRLSPCVLGRISEGGAEIKRTDGEEPNPFLLR